MPLKKIKHTFTKKRKITFKELEWDYMPMIVLFSVVAAILTLILILLAIYNDLLRKEELDKYKGFRYIDNYINRVEPTAEPESEDELILE